MLRLGNSIYENNKRSYNLLKYKPITTEEFIIIDIEEGKNAGCKYSIGITTGAQNREELEKADPDFIFDNISELLTVL